MTDEMKHQYFMLLICIPPGDRPCGLTDKRLHKMKQTILDDKILWKDVDQHAHGLDPEQVLSRYGDVVFDHMISNMWSMVSEKFRGVR